MICYEVRDYLGLRFREVEFDGVLISCGFFKV